jgi:hypothetical protein
VSLSCFADAGTVPGGTPSVVPDSESSITGLPPAVSLVAAPVAMVAELHGFDELDEGVVQLETAGPIPPAMSTGAPFTFSFAELVVDTCPPCLLSLAFSLSTAASQST